MYAPAGRAGLGLDKYHVTVLAMGSRRRTDGLGMGFTSVATPMSGAAPQSGKLWWSRWWWSTLVAATALGNALDFWPRAFWSALYDPDFWYTFLAVKLWGAAGISRRADYFVLLRCCQTNRLFHTCETEKRLLEKQRKGDFRFGISQRRNMRRILGYRSIPLLWWAYLWNTYYQFLKSWGYWA